MLTKKSQEWFDRARSNCPADLNAVGIWVVKGEDPNPDFHGRHHEPLIGYFEGKLEDVINYAVESCRAFFTWGYGGTISAYSHPRVVQIDANSVAADIKKQQRIAQLEAELQELRK